MQITLTFDSEAVCPRYHVGWGFSCYLHETKLLFDTGEDPHKLGHNLKVLGINKESIECVVLSHGHFDHVRGLATLEAFAPKVVVAPSLLDSRLQQEFLDRGFVLTTGNGSQPIMPGVQRVVVSKNGIVEQALVVRGKRGWCFFFGCGHWGVDRWIHALRSEFVGPIDLVMGGYHLLSERPKKIKAIVDGFLAMGVQRVAPCHCTGSQACADFSEAYEERFLDLQVGDHVHV